MSHSRLNEILTALALLVTLGCGNGSDSESDSPASATAAQSGEGDAELRSKLERLTAILDKHGASDAPEIHLQANGDDEANRKELLKLIQPIKDRKAFTSEMLALLTEISDQPDPKLLQNNAELLDLAVNGNTATAKLVQVGQSRTRETPIEFHKVDGEWKIAEAKNLLN